MNIPSMQPQCMPAEWQARVDLAACYCLVDLYGMSDMMANPISSHVADEAAAARSQSRFPDKPISLLVPFGPGGIADLTARAVAELMSKSLG